MQVQRFLVSLCWAEGRAPGKDRCIERERGKNSWEFRVNTRASGCSLTSGGSRPVLLLRVSDRSLDKKALGRGRGRLQGRRGCKRRWDPASPGRPPDHHVAGFHLEHNVRYNSRDRIVDARHPLAGFRSTRKCAYEACLRSSGALEWSNRNRLAKHKGRKQLTWNAYASYIRELYTFVQQCY